MQTSTPNFKRRSISSRKTNDGKERHRTEVSAGGLVFKRAKDGIHFAMVVDSYGKWAFPKGHVRHGERYKDTAIREIREEMGLKNLRHICRLDTIDIWFRDRFVHKGALVHKYIHYFLFEVPVDALLVRPAPKDEGETIKAVAWVPLKELLSRSSYRDMIGIIKKAQRICSSPSSKTLRHSAPKGKA